MIPKHWQDRFMELTHVIGQWSKDEGSKVGAVIVDGKKIVSVGFNGPPSGTSDDRVPREVKLLRTIHAETNALFFANRSLVGCSIFVNKHPCANCAGNIIQFGILDIYCPEPDKDFLSRWAFSIETAQAMFAEVGARVYYL